MLLVVIESGTDDSEEFTLMLKLVAMLLMLMVLLLLVRVVLIARGVLEDSGIGQTNKVCKLHRSSPPSPCCLVPPT